MKRNILVAHGGGPTTVINASLFGVIDEAMRQSSSGKVFGAIHGVEGVLNDELIELSSQDQKQLLLLPYTPASAIGSCRRKLTDADYPRILEVLKKHDIGCFFYNGGNDSMDTCNKIAKLAEASGYDLAVIGHSKNHRQRSCAHRSLPWIWKCRKIYSKQYARSLDGSPSYANVCYHYGDYGAQCRVAYRGRKYSGL